MAETVPRNFAKQTGRIFLANYAISWARSSLLETPGGSVKKIERNSENVKKRKIKSKPRE